MLTAVLAGSVIPVVKAQIYRLSVPDTTAGNFFGTSVAIDQEIAVVGATADTRCGVNSGAIYIYEHQDDDDWKLSASLVPSDCRPGLFFGKTVAVYGNRVVATAFLPFFSASVSNSVYVFDRDPVTGGWTQTAVLQEKTSGTEGAFAASVAVDNDRILVTTSGDTSTGKYGGAAYMYDLVDGKWTRSARLTGSLDPSAGIFGTSCALDGDLAIVSASTYLARRPGSVYIFRRDRDSGDWDEEGILPGIQDFFIPVDLDADRILVGESNAGKGRTGRARIFSRRPDGRWRADRAFKPSVRFGQGGFGSLVALDGDHALVVGFEEQLSFDFNIDRVVYHYIYDRDAGRWKERPIIDVGDVFFGSSIDLSGDVAIIGQASEQRAGQAFVVRIH